MEKKDNFNIAKKVAELAKPIAQSFKVNIWDVEYKKEGADFYLRIFIDKEGGVDIDDCEKVSRALDSVLDEKDFISQNYYLEVSSPGIERELKTPEHFEQYIGNEVSVSLYKPFEGGKSYKGILQEQKDGNIYIKIDDRIVCFEKSNVAKVKLSVEF